MPSRIIRDGCLDSKRVDTLSEQAENFYKRLWMVVDDYGRFEYDPIILLAKTYPRRIARYTIEQVEGWMAECTAGPAPLVICYQIGGKEYLQVQDFGQRIRQDKNGVQVPGRYPSPPCGDSPLKSASSGYSPEVAASDRK